MFGGERCNDFFEIAVHDRFESIEGEVNAMIRNAALRIVVGSNAL